MYKVDIEKNYTYDDIVRLSICINKNYSPFVNMFSIGISHDNRPIFAIKLGKAKKSLIISAGIHGREYINVLVLLKIVIKYSSMYYEGKFSELFEKVSIIFIPCVNPDGYDISQIGFDCIKRSELRDHLPNEIKHYLYKGNANGIDINRNFSCNSFIPTLSMKHPDSEQETLSLINLFKKNESVGYIDVHSRGEMIYYYREAMSDKYNKMQLYYAELFGRISGYGLMKPNMENATGGGNSVQHYAQFYQQPSFTLETGLDNNEFPMKMNEIEEAYERIKDIPIEYLKRLGKDYVQGLSDY